MAPPHILVVDDDVDTLKLVGMILEGRGYRVSKAETGHQALEVAWMELPDLMILDIMLPDLDGYAVARRLREAPATATLPIIMFTAKGMVDDMAAGYEVGVDDYVTKPAYPDELLARVQAVLDRTGTGDKAGKTGLLICLGATPGVGATTLALNCAHTLADQGDAVVLAQLEDRQVLEAPSNLTVGSLPASAGALEWVEGLIAQSDRLVLDLGSHLDADSRPIAAKASRLIIAAEPTRSSLQAASDLLEDLSDAGCVLEQVTVVLVYHAPPVKELNLPAIKEGLAVGHLVILPYEPVWIKDAEVSGSSVVRIAPKSPLAAALRDLATGQWADESS